MVPPSANSKRPARFCRASVKAPFTCPNISLSNRVEEMPPRFTLTKGCRCRLLLRKRAWAISSLPVPLSPVISTEASVGATRLTTSSTLSSWGAVPMMLAKSPWRSSSSRVMVRSVDGVAAAKLSVVFTVCRSCLLVQGLETKSAAPALMPCTANSMDPQAVIKMTGTLAHRCLISRSNSMPSSPLVWRVKFMSCKTSSHPPRSSHSRASAGDAAVAVW